MDEFARAEERIAKRHARLGVPQTVAEAAEWAVQEADAVKIVTDFSPPKPVEQSEPTRKVFNRMAVAVSNGDEQFIYEFEADDFLENMMHSDRTEGGVREKLMAILRAHLTSGIR